MTQHVVVLGGGTGGTLTANRLRRLLSPEELAITVVDQDDRHVYQPGLLFVPFGLTHSEDIVRPRRRQLRDDIRFVESAIDRVDIDTNIVHTTRFDVPAGKQAKVEARRAQIEKAFAARRYGPDKVAKAIVSAVKKNKPIRPVTPEAYFVYGAAHLLPQAMRSTARGKVL